MSSNTAFVIAHRAGNSRQSVRGAFEAGASAVEVDVHLYRGRIEARHARSIGPLPVLADRWWIGRHRGHDLLRDIIAEVPSGCMLVIDLKGRSMRLARSVRRLLDDIGRDRVIFVCARRWRMLNSFQRMPGVTAVHSAGWQWQVRRLERRARTGQVAAVSMHADRVLSDRGLRIVRQVDLVMSWPVNCELRAAKLLQFGVRGCITDEVKVILPVVAASAERAHA